MIHQMFREIVRSITFGRKRRSIHRQAIRSKEGTLQDFGSGYLLTDVQQFNTTGPAGDYVVFVVLPAAPPPPEGYPVLYLLDGNACIAGAADALRLQARFYEEARMEPLMIVAVGYPGTAPIDMGRRAYDYLPAHTSRKLGDRFMQGAPWHQPGGADSFLDFLSGTLRTGLAARYPIDINRQILCGSSFGGFFTLYALLTRPRSFSKYAAISPSLWWDDSRLIKDAPAMALSLPRDLETDVFLAVGDDEIPSRPDISEKMRADTQHMAEYLASLDIEGLSVEHRLLAGENHLSAFMTVFSAILRFSTARKANP